MKTPYQYTTPISSPDQFFNRSSEITRITSRIAAERPQSVSIVGGPRMGKTSIVNYLCHPDVQAQYLDDPTKNLLLHLDLNKLKPETPEQFFQCIAQALSKLSGETMDCTFDGFNAQVKKFMQDRLKLVLFMDDFGLVTQQSGFPLEFFSFMRSVANSNDVGYVTTSPVQLQKLCHTPDIGESPFFNIFTTVTLEPFKEQAARKLVQQPAEQAGHPLAERVDWVLELGGSSPYLLQLAADLAYPSAARDTNLRTLENRAAHESQAFLEEIWQNHCSETEREVLRQVFSGDPVERQHQFAAEALERRGYLKRRDEAYTFDSQLVNRFVESQCNTSIWKRILGR